MHRLSGWLGAAVLLALASLGTSAQAAEYVGDETCVECHEEVVTGMRNNIHQRIRPFDVFDRTVGCEGCHGPGSEHADSGDAEISKYIRSSRCSTLLPPVA